MIEYLRGDVTEFGAGDPEVTKVLAHITNNANGWGAGVVLAISARWSLPEEVFRITPASRDLGHVEIVRVQPRRYVANMTAQDNVTPRISPRVRYGYLDDCLRALSAATTGCEIHMPRIGCGLGGGTWDRVEELISKNLSEHSVFVYDF